MINASIFCSPDFSETEFYAQPITKVELLALAITAQRINGEYIKRGGKSDFVNTIEDGVDTSTYQRIKESNRAVIERLQQVDADIITPELRADAEEMLHNLEMEYMFKVLGDGLNDFETSIQQFLADADLVHGPRMHVGVVAYIPAYVEREANQRELAERSIGSKWIGSKGDAVKLDIEILSTRAATQWDGWNVNAITTDGNRVSFFTTKDDIANMKGEFKILAKVKDCATVWQSPDIKETRLNYVR